MKTVCFIVLAVLILQTSGLPSRVKRQGFGWDYDEDTNVVASSSTRRPTPSRPQSSSTSASGGTTTTTQSPQFVQCVRSCPATPQYNPVCGSDRQTYPNENRLKCAQQCGLTVELVRQGTCSPL